MHRKCDPTDQFSLFQLCFFFRRVQWSDICVRVLCNTMQLILVWGHTYGEVSLRKILQRHIRGWRADEYTRCTTVFCRMIRHLLLLWVKQQKFWMVEEIFHDGRLSSAHSELFSCFFEQVYPQNCVIQLFIKWRKIFSNPGLSPSGMCAPVRQHTQTDKDSSRCGYGYEVNLNLSQRREKHGEKNLEKLPIKRI